MGSRSERSWLFPVVRLLRYWISDVVDLVKVYWGLRNVYVSVGAVGHWTLAWVLSFVLLELLIRWSSTESFGESANVDCR